MLRLIKVLFLTLLMLVALLLGMDLHVRNAHVVGVNYFGGSTEVPVSVLIALTLLAGAMLGIFATLVTTRLGRPRRHPALVIAQETPPAPATKRAKSSASGRDGG